nr:MAG TPA: Membrane bound O-acyl transferase family [Caudoviricetes sp.]
MGRKHQNFRFNTSACGGFPPRPLSISSSNPKNPLAFLLSGCIHTC